MPTLEHNSLVFRFPGIEQNARFSIGFERTLRIPDTDKLYPLPPGLGSFCLRHTEDHADHLPRTTVERGGVILPIWQSEAMWISFHSHGFGDGFPVAIKIAAGKINAVTGESWRSGLNRDPQDYLVSPGQPWLDGFAVEKGVIRQFVAMPLGEGYSAEEQITGEAAWGGLQISVTPIKTSVWQRLKKARKEAWKHATRSPRSMDVCLHAPMGLAPGGRMSQAIYPDKFNLDDWDIAATDRVFVTLVHAKDWKSITGEAPATFPPSSQEYAEAHLPWFEFYGADSEALEGSGKLAGLTSVAKKFKHNTGVTLPDSGDVATGAPVGAYRAVRSTDF